MKGGNRMSLMRKLLEDKIAEYPFESQDGLGFDAKCIAHFFVAAAHWFISEMEVAEVDEGVTDVIMFGYADLGYGPGCSEFGYVSLNEIESLITPYGEVELDLNEEGKTIRELCEEYELEYDDFFSGHNNYGIEEDER
jgi:hypothetical protein